jgi:hypothetical protein
MSPSLLISSPPACHLQDEHNQLVLKRFLVAELLEKHEQVVLTSNCAVIELICCVYETLSQ